MGDVVDAAAGAILAAGLVVVLAGLSRGWVRPALTAGLDLWLAAGLLRLSADASWMALASVAALVLVRSLVPTVVTKA